MAASQHSTRELIIVAAASVAMGAAVGVAISQRAARDRLRHARAKLSQLAASVGLTSADTAHKPAEHTNGELHAHALDFHDDIDTAELAKWRVAFVIRSDELQAGDLVIRASKTLLGLFKKLYKRRDPALKMWEGGGSRMEVRVASSEGVLVAVQQAARAANLPTHTFAGVQGQGKQRSLMMVGPAEKERLWEIVGRLEEA